MPNEVTEEIAYATDPATVLCMNYLLYHASSTI